MSKPQPPSGRKIAERIQEASRRDAAGQAFGAVGVGMREIIAEARLAIFTPESDGEKAAARFARIMDFAIIALAENGASDAASSIAILATGGYGRGVLSPHSDVDLLFLHSGKNEKELRTQINPILYPLWDSGLTIGQGVHTVASALALAKRDLTAQTAFLEARFVWGQKKNFETFAERYNEHRLKSRSAFLKKKRAEQTGRHEIYARTQYQVEPDLKEARGGLRDIDTIGWLYRFQTGFDIFSDHERGGLLQRDEIKSLRRARSLLMAMRAGLHMERGRADDRMTFDIQPALAERLGYAERPNATAPERLVKHYFINALEIGRLSRVFLARLEEVQGLTRDRTPRLLPTTLGRDEVPGPVNIRLRTNRLDFAQVAAARRNPLDFFRLFRAFARRPDFDLHPDALSLIAKSLPLITKEVRNDSLIAESFIKILMTAKQPARVLRLMSEAGLLAKYIPLFGAITGQIEYGRYRRYSIEEQCFLAMDVLAALIRGEMMDDFPLASKAAQRLKNDPALYLVVLLHEASLSLKEPDVIRTQRLLGRVLGRLGLDGEALDAAVFVAAHPLILARQSERRNLAEDRTVEDFAEKIGDTYRLDLSLILTVCRLSVLRGHSWGEGARGHTALLYEATHAMLSGGIEALNDWRSERAVINARRLGEKSALERILPQGLLAVTQGATLMRANALIEAAGRMFD